MDLSSSWIYFIKRRCLRFCFYPVLTACLQSEIDSGEFQLLHWKAYSANLPPFCTVTGAYVYLDAYKYNVVAAIRMVAYVHGVLILCGCVLSWFYGIWFALNICPLLQCGVDIVHDCPGQHISGPIPQNINNWLMVQQINSWGVTC